MQVRGWRKAIFFYSSIDIAYYVDYRRHMEMKAAVAALGALAQESRLRVFRLLIQHGEAGLAAGRIASAVGVPHNTLSTHLAILQNAGLVTSRRESRSIIYRIHFDGMRGLMAYLLQDCCRAEHASIEPLLASLAPDCCQPNQPGDAS